MFLSKKNAVYFNKPKTIDSTKPKRILAGWEEDTEDKRDPYDFSERTESKPQPPNLLLGEEFTDLTAEKSERREGREKFYLTWDELDERADVYPECEKRLVEDIVQPGGIRIKPNDNMLGQFLKEIKGMQVHIIGSLLLSKLEANYPFPTKAKSLYTIEFLIKKNEKYLSYFKANVDKIRDFPEPEDNVDNYRKIQKVVLNFIGISNPQPEEEQKQVFVDPGYNDDPKSAIGNFIQSNTNKVKKTEQKKIIIGPGQQKPKINEEKKPANVINNDFLSLDLLGTGNLNNQVKPHDSFSLLEDGGFKPNSNNFGNFLI